MLFSFLRFPVFVSCILIAPFLLFKQTPSGLYKNQSSDLPINFYLPYIYSLYIYIVCQLAAQIACHKSNECL